MKRMFLIAAALMMMAGTASAQGSSAPADGSKRAQWCADNPGKCETAKAKRQAACDKNPEKCEQAKARREEMKAKCAADPDACKARAETLKERRKARQDKATPAQ